jgi:hypothetical protein
VLNIGEGEYLSKLGGASGARVIFGSQNEMPHPEEEGIMAEPGKLVSVGLKKVRNVMIYLYRVYENCTYVICGFF